MTRGLWMVMILASPVPAFAQDGAVIVAEDGSTVPTATPAATPTPVTVPAADWAAVKAEAEARTAAFGAMKAAAEAEKAATEAKAAAGLAKIGTVTGQTVIPGTVTMNNHTPKAEALLLVTRSTRLAAESIAPKVAPALGRRKAETVLLLTGPEELATGDAIQFELQMRSIAAALRLAQTRFAEAQRVDSSPIAADAGTMRMAILPAAGALIDAVAKLGSYFQADYSFGTVEVSATPARVATALVTELRDKGVVNPIIIPRFLVASDVDTLVTKLDPVQADYWTVVGQQATAEARAAALGKADGAGQRVAQLYTLAAGAAGRAIAAYDTWNSALFADPAAGTEPRVVRVIRQLAIQQALKRKPMILLLNSEAAAAFYTKKSLWTFLVGPPLYTMGGIALSYALYEADGGAVLVAGTVGKHGGYRSVRDVEKLFP